MPDGAATRELPQGLDHGRHVDLRRRRAEPWARRGILLLLAAVVAAALLNAFGQVQSVRTVATPAATLQVTAPDRVRGGLFFQGRFDITTPTGLKDPRLVLARGWNEQLQVDTIEPSPSDEYSEDGRVELRYGAVDPAHKLTVWMEFEANPTGVGHRDQTVELRDGRRTVAVLHRTLTILP
ncbi:hypothetical protein NBH00_20545 [Paraconexibacter antarcticus]|uniref:Uncharacterized protein n=1 Tax=Paraconexibacter antarcticus TaxID=2949664 RepID=A0ABY5DSQ8_9ACTN|nr:hypothetical protein [Paraconexibacter antarcticus]UTI63720.1 hypothetical protein NBH00_20545 [Paraconexibacter antarcticus]